MPSQYRISKAAVLSLSKKGVVVHNGIIKTQEEADSGKGITIEHSLRNPLANFFGKKHHLDLSEKVDLSDFRIIGYTDDGGDNMGMFSSDDVKSNFNASKPLTKHNMGKNLHYIFVDKFELEIVLNSSYHKDFVKLVNDTTDFEKRGPEFKKNVQLAWSKVKGLFPKNNWNSNTESDALLKKFEYTPPQEPK